MPYNTVYKYRVPGIRWNDGHPPTYFLAGFVDNENNHRYRYQVPGMVQTPINASVMELRFGYGRVSFCYWNISSRCFHSDYSRSPPTPVACRDAVLKFSPEGFVVFLLLCIWCAARANIFCSLPLPLRGPWSLKRACRVLLAIFAAITEEVVTRLLLCFEVHVSYKRAPKQWTTTRIHPFVSFLGVPTEKVATIVVVVVVVADYSSTGHSRRQQQSDV